MAHLGLNTRKGPYHGLIVSQGRKQPTAPQAIVVHTDRAARGEYQRRARLTGKDRLPTGSQAEFDILKGELAFAYVPGKTVVARLNPNAADRECFTSFNGLSPADAVTFAGVVDKGYTHSDTPGNSLITLRLAGTATIVNTGSQPVGTGDEVAWAFPEVRLLANGQAAPTVRQVGVPDSKFVARVVPILFEDAYRMFANAYKKARDEADGAGLGAYLTSATLAHIVKDLDPGATIPVGVTQDDRDAAPSNRPLYRWLGMLFLDPNDDSWAHESRAAQDHRAALAGAAYGPRARKRARYGVGLRDQVRGPVPIMKNTGGKKREQYVALMGVKFVLDHVAVMRRHRIGVALSTANPGQPLDIFMN